MTAFYILVTSEDECRDLIHGHASPAIRSMAKTWLDWELEELQAIQAAKPVPKARKARKARKTRPAA